MSVRNRAILLAAVFVLLLLVWFFFMFRPNQRRISELRAEQEQVQQEIGGLQVQLERLRELQRQEPQLRAQFARLQDALPDDPRLPDFILQVQEAANLAGIDFLSITPSLPAAFTPPGAMQPPPEAAQLQAISVSISVTGTYFEVEDFIIRLERLQRAVRIGSFTLAPGEGAAGGSPTLSTTLQMQMFMVSPAPVVQQPPGAPPPPAPAPAPGAPTPVPEVTPEAVPPPGGP